MSKLAIIADRAAGHHHESDACWCARDIAERVNLSVRRLQPRADTSMLCAAPSVQASLERYFASHDD
ncbi:MAG: hypothetical protein WKH97_05095 [Casimicrobiaceae bacterium]